MRANIVPGILSFLFWSCILFIFYCVPHIIFFKDGPFDLFKLLIRFIEDFDILHMLAVLVVASLGGLVFWSVTIVSVLFLVAYLLEQKIPKKK